MWMEHDPNDSPSHSIVKPRQRNDGEDERRETEANDQKDRCSAGACPDQVLNDLAVQSVDRSVVGERCTHSPKNEVDDVDITREQVQDPMVSGQQPSSIQGPSYLPIGVISKKLNGDLMTESNICPAQFVNVSLIGIDKRTESCKYLELLKEHNTKINNPPVPADKIDIKLKNPYPSKYGSPSPAFFPDSRLPSPQRRSMKVDMTCRTCAKNMTSKKKQKPGLDAARRYCK